VRPPLRVRVTVRVLMVLVLLIACGLGWIVHRAHVQRDAVAVIVRGGGTVLYDWDVTYVPGQRYGAVYRSTMNGKPWWPKWLIDHLGPDYFGDVKLVELGPKDSDGQMASVGQLSRLGALYATYRGTRVTDAGMVHVRGLNQLEELTMFNRDTITRAGLASLRDLKQLRRLDILFARDYGDDALFCLSDLTALRGLTLRSPKITDAGLVHLRSLVELRSLDLMFTSVGAAGLHHLRPMTRLEFLVLNGTRVDDLAPIRHLTGLKFLSIANTRMTDAGLTGLEGLHSLQGLDLSSTRVTDAGLEHLRGLKKLRSLRIRNTKVSNQAFVALQQVLPSLTQPPVRTQAAPKRPLPKAE
jgi:hypothetical protein